MPKLELVIFANYVLLFGQPVLRPARVSPSQWYKYWEQWERKA